MLLRVSQPGYWPGERRPLLAQPGCAMRIYSKRNTDKQLYASHGLTVLPPSLALPPSLTLSLSLSLLSQSVHCDAAQRQDLASASSSYLTHPPRFTHSTRGAISCPAVLLKVARPREGGRFRSPVTLLLWLASGGLTALDVAELRIPDRL